MSESSPFTLTRPATPGHHRPENATAERVWIHPEANLAVKTKGPPEKRALLRTRNGQTAERRDYLTTISPVMPECIVQ